MKEKARVAHCRVKAGDQRHFSPVLDPKARQAHLLRFKPGELASNKAGAAIQGLQQSKNAEDSQHGGVIKKPEPPHAMDRYVTYILTCLDSPIFASQDQLGTGIFVVREGSFKLMNTSGRESFLGPGCVFGELELVQGCAGEVVAGDLGGTCFTISSMALLSTIKALARTIGSRNLRFLSAVPLFRFLDSPDLAMLGRYAFSITHAKDACIYEAGQMPKEFLYIVKSGCLISQSNGRERYIYPGECLDQVSAWCSRPHAETVRVSNEDDAAGMLAFSFQLLQDVLGDHMPDFLWRCSLLRMLRDVWSDRLSFGGPLMWRDDPEAFARACIIRSFPASSSELFSADETASILWYVVLDGSLRTTGEDAMPGCSFCVGEGYRGKQIRTTRDGCTLAMFLQDAIGAAAPYGDKLEVVKSALIFRNLDRTQQAQLAEAGHLLLRRNVFTALMSLCIGKTA